jgi:hypothetical protein
MGGISEFMISMLAESKGFMGEIQGAANAITRKNTRTTKLAMATMSRRKLYRKYDALNCCNFVFIWFLLS